MPNLTGTSGDKNPGYATKNYGTDGKPKCTVTQKNVLKGINWAEVKGKHRLEKDPNVSLVITPSTKRKAGPILLETDRDLESETGSIIDEKKTSQNEFMASNSDMRGHQSARVFRGNRVYRWSPSRDFRPDAVGDVVRGGAFKGGFVNEALQKSYKGYAPHMGHQKKGLAINGETLKNVNPFSINLRVKPKDLKVGRTRL